MKTTPWFITITTLSSLLFLSPGCKTYMHFKYGLTQPKQETPVSLTNFVEKNHFPNDNLFMFSDSGSYFQAIRNPVFSKHLLSHMIFDRSGALLQNDTTKCQWAGFDKVKSLDPDSSYEKCYDLQLEQILNHIKPFGKIIGPDNVDKDPDFTVVVTWAKFIGTYNHRLFVLSDAAEENKTARIRLIWLNIDMQECWKLSRQQKIAIK